MESPLPPHPPVISPLVTSALRFLFISVLVVCNGSAFWRVAAGKHQSTVRSRRGSQIIICTVLCVNLLYLCLVWAPFTLQALSHDVHAVQKAFGDDSHREASYSKLMLEDGEGVIIEEEISFSSSAKFVSDARGQSLGDNQHKMRRDLSDDKRAEWSAIFDGARRQAQRGHPHRLSLTAGEKSGGGSLSWGSGMQDLITSSCAYTLAFTAVMKTAIQRMHVMFPSGSWALGGIVGVMISLPTALTLTLRLLVSGPHFSAHELELTSSGYTFYNIICDVHITESYVVSLFLEWAALLTLVLLATGILLACRLRAQNSQKLPLEEQDEQESRGIEDWARDIVLVIDAAWAWPVKPALVLALYCTYGPHWTNLVCWLSHLVVSIPVVFLPLAVFLTRTSDISTSTDAQVILTQKQQSSTTKEKSIITESKASEKSKSKSVSKDSKIENSNTEVSQDIHENLKFYLGKNIFKNKEENLSNNPNGNNSNNMRLKNESAHPSFSDV